jgi:hypothetical protein
VSASRGTPMKAHSSVMFPMFNSSEPPCDPSMYKRTSSVHVPAAIASCSPTWTNTPGATTSAKDVGSGPYSRSPAASRASGLSW